MDFDKCLNLLRTKYLAIYREKYWRATPAPLSDPALALAFTNSCYVST